MIEAVVGTPGGGPDPQVPIQAVGGRVGGERKVQRHVGAAGELDVEDRGVGAKASAANKAG